MLPRFVVVPAVSVEKQSCRAGIKHHSEIYPCAFDIYDNQEKVRLTHGFHDKTAAEAACAGMNIDARKPAE